MLIKEAFSMLARCFCEMGLNKMITHYKNGAYIKRVSIPQFLIPFVATR